jgi:phosphatidylglycerol:prolipoprotein diacylglycerol transferase
MAQLVSLLLIAAGGLGLWWLYGRGRALPDPSGVASANPNGGATP